MNPDWQPAPDYLRDRVILVTGAGAGIGRAIAAEAAALGATLVLLDKDVPAMESLYDAIEQAGHPQPAIYPMNLEGAKPQDYEDLAATLKREFGRLDGLVHNAAVLGALMPIDHHDVEHWFRVMQVNLNAPFLLTRACLPLLREAPDASIVFTADEVGRKGRAYWGAYGVSKAGLEGLMQILADELENNTPVRVNSLDPGPAHTRLRLQAYPAEDASRLPAPEDVVRPFLYLLGPDARGTTGRQLSLTEWRPSKR